MAREELAFGTFSLLGVSCNQAEDFQLLGRNSV